MKTKFTIAILGCSLLLWSCVMRPEGYVDPADRKVEDYFDFKIDQQVALNVDYGFDNSNYFVICEVYDQYPLIEGKNGEFVKKNIEPIYRGATDKTGKLSTTFKALIATEKVWVYSDDAGALSPIEVEIKANAINFNQNDYIADMRNIRTKATTAGGNKYPDGWMILGEWDQYGTPKYLDPDRHFPPSQMLYALNKTFARIDPILSVKNPEFFAPGIRSDLTITKPTKVYMTYIKSTSGWRNSVGYYTYKQGEEPKTPADVKRILAFPNATPIVKVEAGVTTRGAMATGDRVQLKYWDESKSKFVEEFPAGVTIGFWLEGMSYLKENSGTIAIQGGQYFYSRFSADHLNRDMQRRTVAVFDAKTKNLAAIAFEDNTDMFYNDATFYIEVSEDNSIDPGPIPELPDIDPPATVDNVKFGTFMFEDLWPSSGDYDMNDVMIKYKNTIYKNTNNNNSVYKVVSEYLPYHSGGSLISTFAVQLTGVDRGLVHKVSIARGEDGASQPLALEDGQTYPTFILYDNIRQAIGQKVTVTIELNDAPEKSIVSPFNPFIIVDNNREREVHFVNYKPTDKAGLLGRYNDGSNKDLGLFYVMKNPNQIQFPFAMDMASIEQMPVPTERVRIDESYPNFTKWVQSKGKEQKDWYLKPKK